MFRNIWNTYTDEIIYSRTIQTLFYYKVQELHHNVDSQVFEFVECRVARSLLRQWEIPTKAHSFIHSLHYVINSYYIKLYILLQTQNKVLSKIIVELES